ncbi:eukaryotic translation initiation factor 3 subunit J-like [Haliotis cracherodii]|uniref:eukaryotic translation initiation factor 3 subunit J-like n=1 Tax=Haliotis cracherodii TaxID=6455 RepID=UPI0039E7AE45
MPPSRKGQSWTDEETECLLSVWNEKNVEEQLGDPKKNKSAIYVIIAQEMKIHGFEKNAAQCKIRMHTLKRTYWDCKKNQKISGTGRKVCRDYHLLNEILGQRPSTSPVKVVESMGRAQSLASDDTPDNSESDEMEAADTPDDMAGGTTGGGTEFDVSDENEENKDAGMKNETNDEGSKEEGKKDEQKSEQKKKIKKLEKRERKTKLEVTLGSIMKSYSENNNKFEASLMSLEEKNVDAELKKIELEGRN